MIPSTTSRAALLALLVLAAPAAADPFFFATGGPDGRLATASGPVGEREVETADDFMVGRSVTLQSGRLVGLAPLGAGARVKSLELEFYRVFPGDSARPSGRVPTRVNSPADEDFAARDSAAGELGFTASLFASGYTAGNSVVNGIDVAPNQFTGGQGAVTGDMIGIDFFLGAPLRLDPGHYFFRPRVELEDGGFLWLSAARPIGADGTPFAPDLQSWIRDSALSPDWLRIGTDITGAPPANAVFSLEGSTVPEPATWAMLIVGFGLVGASLRRRATRAVLA